MFTLLSVVTAVKDYIEVVHKLVETNTPTTLDGLSYTDFGAIITYVVMSVKEIFVSILTFQWLQNITLLPLIVPNIASAMISEISVLDGYFHNAFTFLETPVSYGNQNMLFYGIEKFSIGLVNSLFLCLPTSIAHIITLRRFVMQGLEAGYIAGLGTICGNLLWIGSIIFGLRFLVIPWLSFDLLRYGLGTLLLVKYMWDSYSERRNVLEDLSKRKIFLLNFLLAFTEQATIYPFLSNLSFGSDSSIIETFPTGSFFEYSMIHVFYVLGLFIGSLSLLQLTCWFWENPAFNIYMWTMSSLKVTNPFSQRFVNLFFLYLTMLFSVCNLSYFGLDYTIANPLGLVHEDRITDGLLESSFINTKASDRNTRRNRGRHGRRERWKRRVRRYRTFDASLYDQGIYDLFTIEDLNYGFDRFWLRRKIRNHRVRFRFFPGPWMRSFKKQLAKPRLESFMGPRVEFFRILFEQSYHPEFHEFRDSTKINSKKKHVQSNNSSLLSEFQGNSLISYYSDRNEKLLKENLMKEHSALRKFIRKIKTRTSGAQLLSEIDKPGISRNTLKSNFENRKHIYSKRWKQIFSKISHEKKGFEQNFLTNFYNKTILNASSLKTGTVKYFPNFELFKEKSQVPSLNNYKQNSEKQLSKKDRQILRYKTFLKDSTKATSKNLQSYEPLTLLHPIKFYLQKEKAFQKKMKFYGSTLFRNFGIENNAPYYRIMMKKFFYYYKPTLRWERTMRTATMRKARRKGPRIPRKLNVSKQTQMLAENSIQNSDSTAVKNLENRVKNQAINVSTGTPTGFTTIQKPTHFYSLVSKRATRYRYQIYKDVLQHWYYSPFNRLLLKFDVDSFIRRQPKSHFLTKKEENLLHLKRFLLGDYYNALRWYSSMQHYDSMTRKIGKTKSFANTAYNQQFFGTFKKIRHLFAITPSLTENTVLKFDQPLFNEYNNKEENLNKSGVLYSSSSVHEELLADTELYGNFQSLKKLPETLTNQSTFILKDYLEKATPERQNYIRKLLEEENYKELTNFLFKGQKTRGDVPITNETLLLEQENNALLKHKNGYLEKEKIQKFLNTQIFANSLNSTNLETFTDSRSTWVALMKKAQNLLYNQEALKNYVQNRVEKSEKIKKNEQKAFKRRLEIMKNWVHLEKNPSVSSSSKIFSEKNQISGLRTSLQKALKEGLYDELGGKISGKPLEKSNLRSNRPKILQNFSQFTAKEFSKDEKKIITSNLLFNTRLIKPEKTKNLALQLKSHLNNRAKLRAFETLEAEEDLRKNLSSIQQMLKDKNSNLLVTNLNPSLLSKIFTQTITPFRWISAKIFNSVRSSENSTNGINVLKPFQYTFSFLTRNKAKNLKNWKKRETVLSTRKKIRRKIYRVLDQKKQQTKVSNVSELEKFMLNADSGILRQKEDLLSLLETQRNKKTWKLYETEAILNPDFLKDQRNKNQLFKEIFEKKFKKKRTRSRRYRRFKGRGPIKKHTLAEKLKRQFKLLKRYGERSNDTNKKMEILEMITKRKYNAELSFETRDIKQRRTRQSKHRFWKKHKRQKYLQTKRKQRKRRRYSISKLRVLNKEFKRIRNQNELKKWWWQTFLPNFMSRQDALWKVEKNKQMKQELEKLSISEILARDESQRLKTKENTLLQIGDTDFKPLSTPQALRLRNELNENGELNFGQRPEIVSSLGFDENSSKVSFSTVTISDSKDETSLKPNILNKSILSNFSNNLFEQKTLKTEKFKNVETGSRKFVGLNPMPFYAGWDETLRQFVVTNRLLSRKDAGYAMNLSQGPVVSEAFNSLKPQFKEGLLNFTKAPLQGMNAATTLYWQIPFTTYDPDQFFALGMDGFSPLGWRFFNFKHSKETVQPLLVQNIFSNSEQTLKNQSLLSYNIQLKMLNLSSKNLKNELEISKNNRISKNQSRKIQKRQKRVKKHPRPPVWFPSGPLTNQVLPVHYIYVFYKRTRLPRDRYLGRRFRRSDDTKASFIQSNFTKQIDFTLRKRVKPIRKYHRKRTINKGQENSLILRRRSFKALINESIRFRPMTKNKLNTQTDFLNSSLAKTKQRKRNLNTKPNAENLRIRQLRRRVQRQVLRPISRYKPRAGGFIWPGDYLRLETTKGPNLKTLSKSAQNDIMQSVEKPNQKKPNTQIRKKKRRPIQEWQIQPKKYLLQKHNLKVLKKRFQQSQNVDLTSQKLKQLHLTL